MKGTILAWRGMVFALCELGASAQSNTAAPISTHSSGQTSFTNRALLLDRYCVTCHNQRMKTANVMFDTMDVTDVSQNPQTWERAVRKLRGGMMPPPGAARVVGT